MSADWLVELTKAIEITNEGADPLIKEQEKMSRILGTVSV
jgi:hypothetical protein